MSKILHFVAIAAGILAIVLASFQKDDLVKYIEKQQYKGLSAYINEVVSAVDELDLKQFDSSRNPDLFKDFLRKENHAVFVSDGEKWIYWSTTGINPKIDNEDCDSFIRLLSSPTGKDFVVFKKVGKLKYYLISHLKNNQKISEKNKGIVPNAPYDKWSFSNSFEGYGVQIFSSANDFIFNAMVPQRQVSKVLWIDMTLLLIIFLLIFSLCSKTFTFGFSVALSTSVIIVIYRFLYSIKLGFEGMHHFKLFSASAYASSHWIPSLGDLLLNSILFFLVTLMFLQKGEKTFNRNRDLSWLYGGVILFINCIIFYYISSLFNDSQVSFNFNDLNSINNNSFLGIFIVLIWFMILHHLNGSLFRNFEVGFAQVAATLLLLLLLSQLTQVGLSQYLLLGLLFFSFYYLLHKLAKRFNWTSLLFIEFIAFSFVFTYINYTVTEHKEKNYRKYYLKNEVYDKKEQIEHLLKLAETQIADDTLLLGHNTYGAYDYGNINKRVTQLYFNTISKDYELNIYSYNEDGRNIYEPSNQMNMGYLTSLYNNLPFNNNLNYFKRLNNTSVPIDYIAKYDKCGPDNQFLGGEVYLLLNHKSFAVQELESTNFASWVETENRNKKYSYAIYDESGFIDKRKGSVNYPVAIPIDFVSYNDTFICDDDISHYILKHPIYNQVNIVSIRTAGLGNIVTNFSFFVLICLVIGILILLLVYLLSRVLKALGSLRLRVNIGNYLDKWAPILEFNNLFLSRKIIVSLVSIVLIGFLVTLFFVLRFIQQSEKTRMSERHFIKVEETINRLEGKSFSDILIENQKNGFLLALADELNKDILIYGKHGELYTSTSQLIANGEYFAPLVPYPILQRLARSNTGIENLEICLGERHFTSYFFALLDDNKDLTGILSLPHFEHETILNNNASDLIKTLVNLYALLALIGMIVVVFIARGISKPLNMLSSRLAELNLGGAYKPIEWRGNDEIAQLVQQYNSTVRQLKISTEKLAETERQGAWKEMAKQVAHEIKNPLTPMRLNLQHLQMTMKKEGESLDDKKGKIIQVLLTQIDKLTRLADDFGSFARITESNPEVLKPTEIVEHEVMLFDKEQNVIFQNETTLFDKMILADRIAFERVLGNIFKNAIQAMEGDGTITIKDEIETGFYILSIKDTGKGIGLELKDKIFNPNFSTKTSGMGIGLALSKRIIENAHGEIYFTSKLGKGATFYIKVPLFQQ